MVFASVGSVMTVQFFAERGTPTRGFKILNTCLNLEFSYVTHAVKGDKISIVFQELCRDILLLNVKT
jgi:hypothetical protein